MTRPLHPFAYTLLIVPFGAVGGFVTVALAFLATKRGLTVAEGATLIAINMLPHTYKFIWAPIVDTTLTRKTWYGISVAACIVGTVGMAAIPLNSENLNLVRGMILLASTAASFLGMAVEGLMAHLTPEGERGRVGGWFQAGNLGGSGIGGALGLDLLTDLPQPWMAGVGLGAVFLFCALPVLRMADVPAEVSNGGPLDKVRGVLFDLWSVFRTRNGAICAILCFLPVGTGAASGVLAQAEIAGLWGAGEREVVLVNGLLNGVVAAVGCLVGGLICARINARSAYLGIGVLMAATTATMAVLPLSPTVFVVMGLSYAFVTGLAYAAFTGFVLEAIGAGAAATKYNIFASLSNIPIAYMGLVLAHAVTEWGGARSMLWTEAAAGVAGVLVLMAILALWRPKAQPA